jgi:hypothetical protein
MAFLAAWLATTQVEHELGIGLRRGLWFLVFAAPLFCAIYHRGKVQAFWVGVLLALVMIALPANWPLARYQPQFEYAHLLARYFAERAPATSFHAIYFALYDSFSLLGAVALGAVTGLISSAIYSRARRTSE